MLAAISSAKFRVSSLLAIVVVLAASALVHPQEAHVLPTAPVGLTGLANSGSATLAWQNSGASTYTVLRGTSASSVTTVVATGVTGTSWTDTTVTNSSTYYYAVRDGSSVSNPVSNVTGITPRAATCTTGNNIVKENCFPGTTAWKLTNAGAAPGGIEGYATATSVNAGGTLDLKVNAAANAPYRIEIYRTGYYGGNQGRLVATIPNLSATAQDACSGPDSSTGLIDCGGWSVSASLTTTSAWPTGVYLARLVRTDNSSDNHILFVVRHDGETAPVGYRIPDTSYQSYNNYGGKSAYTYSSWGDNTVAGTPRAVKISYNRPYKQTLTNDRDWYTSGDLATVSWMERQGFDIDYNSTLDVDTGSANLSSHLTNVSGAHDEYWSQAMRTAATNARNAGKSLMFTGANEAYWRIRFETSPVTGTANRTQVCYKTTESGATDPNGPTGTWRDVAGANQPENALVGQMYIGDNDSVYFPLKVTAAQAQHRFWRHTVEQTLSPGQTDSIGQNLIGWEWDARASNGLEPAGVTTLSSSPVTGEILTDNGHVYQTNVSATAMSTIYKTAGGATVWASGTNQWSRGLATNMAGVGEPNAIIQQATLNLLVDMGATPTTPSSGMVVDTSGPWSVTGRVPASGASAASTTGNVTATFDKSLDPSTLTSSSMTLTPSGGSAVAATVSYDTATDIATLDPTAQLAGNTTYTLRITTAAKTWVGGAPAADVTWTFTTGQGQPPTITSRTPASGATDVSPAASINAVFDRDINPATATSSTFQVSGPSGAVAGAISYNSSQQKLTFTPQQDLQPTTSYTVTATSGIQAADGTSMASTQTWSFTTSTPLTITSRAPDITATGLSPASDVRVSFSRAVDPTTLTSSTFSLTGPSGAVAGSISYDAATKSATLLPSAPLSLSTTYTVSVTTGVMAADGEPLGSISSWTFMTAATAPPAPAVTSRYPAPNALAVPVSAPIQATFDRAIDAGSLTAQSFRLTNAAGVAQSASISYDATNQTATLIPTGQLQPGAAYTAQVTTAVRSTLRAPLATTVTWSFTAADCPCNLFPNTLTPAATNLDVRDDRGGTGPWTYEMGTKIAVDQSMKLVALRFYKDAGETGTHIGRVWSSTGTSLGTVTFANESASGWQRQALATPITLTAGATYTVSVNVNTRFVSTVNGLASQVTAGPLRTVVGSNGVFGASAGTYPTGSWSNSNYFVDAVVRSPTQTAPAPGVTSVSPLNGATGVAATAQVKATFDQPLDPATVTTSSVSLKTSGGTAVPATVGYSAATQTVTLTPSSALADATTYTARIETVVKSDEGTPLSGVVTWSFTTAAPAAPAVTATSPSTGATGIGTATAPTATFSTAMDASTLTSSNVTLTPSGGSAVTATVSYDSAARTVTIAPSALLSPSTTYTATVSTAAKSAAGTALASPVSWTFTTVACPCSLYSPSATPASTNNDTRDGRGGTGPWTYELGVKVQASSNVGLTAIKFYKSPNETGTHVGRLWSANGTLIASVTFTGESSSGWQQQAFSTPPTLTAGQTYTLSVGYNAYFPATSQGLASAITSGPLSSVVGSNGVYATTAGTFPTASWANTSYFVDGVVQ